VLEKKEKKTKKKRETEALGPEYFRTIPVLF